MKECQSTIIDLVMLIYQIPEGPIIEYTFPDSNLKFILFKTLRDLFFSYFFDKLFNFIKLFIF